MADETTVLRRLQNAPADRKTLTAADFDRSLGTSGSRSLLAEFQAERAIAVRAGKPFDLSVVATETFSTDGSGTQQTFNLSHDLIDSDAVGTTFLLYSGNTVASADSVDYAGDSFDYTDGGSVEDLTVYYTAGDQARLEIQKVAPNGTPAPLWSEDVGMVHRRDQAKDPLEFDFSDPFEAVVPTDFTIEVYVDAPYTATLVGQDGDGGNDVEPATNALLDVPIIGAPGKIAGAGEVVRRKMAER
jgi:hypothetical protein